MTVNRTYIVQPLPVTITSTDAQTIAPLSNLLSDEMAMVWRSSGTTASIVFTSPASVDTIALINTNLRSSDTVRVRAGSTTSVADYDSGTLAAWSGAKADWINAKTILKLPVASVHNFWQIDISSPGNPDGFIEVSRLCVGAALSHVGIDSDAELSILDQSTVDQGAGFQTYIEYPTVPIWKVSYDQIADTAFMTDWFNFFGKVGNRRCILFVPDSTNSAWAQNYAVFGTLIGENVAKHPLSDMWSMDITIRGKTG